MKTLTSKVLATAVMSSVFAAGCVKSKASDTKFLQGRDHRPADFSNQPADMTKEMGSATMLYLWVSGSEMEKVLTASGFKRNSVPTFVDFSQFLLPGESYSTGKETLGRPNDTQGMLSGISQLSQLLDNQLITLNRNGLHAGKKLPFNMMPDYQTEAERHLLGFEIIDTRTNTAIDLTTLTSNKFGHPVWRTLRDTYQSEDTKDLKYLRDKNDDKIPTVQRRNFIFDRELASFMKLKVHRPSVYMAEQAAKVIKVSSTNMRNFTITNYAHHAINLSKKKLHASAGKVDDLLFVKSVLQLADQDKQLLTWVSEIREMIKKPSLKARIIDEVALYREPLYDHRVYQWAKFQNVLSACKKLSLSCSELK